MEERESKVKDLEEKLHRGELTPKEALKELRKRGLVEHERWEIIPWVIYLILWVPFNILFSDKLLTVHFPLVVICILSAIIAFGIYLGVWATRLHYKKGGIKDDQTVTLINEGPYRVMRHPAVGFMLLPILLPIVLSSVIPFTPLSATAMAVMIVITLYGCWKEEKELNIPKWGDEYLRYMKEVPRYNLILGLWRLRKRGERREFK